VTFGLGNRCSIRLSYGTVEDLGRRMRDAAFCWSSHSVPPGARSKTSRATWRELDKAARSPWTDTPLRPPPEPTGMARRAGDGILAAFAGQDGLTVDAGRDLLRNPPPAAWARRGTMVPSACRLSIVLRSGGAAPPLPSRCGDCRAPDPAENGGPIPRQNPGRRPYAAVLGVAIASGIVGAASPQPLATSGRTPSQRARIAADENHAGPHKNCCSARPRRGRCDGTVERGKCSDLLTAATAVRGSLRGRWDRLLAGSGCATARGRFWPTIARAFSNLTLHNVNIVSCLLQTPPGEPLRLSRRGGRIRRVP
jgi:hypothetical protein